MASAVQAAMLVLMVGPTGVRRRVDQPSAYPTGAPAAVQATVPYVEEDPSHRR